jgi:hypothetical protein
MQDTLRAYATQMKIRKDWIGAAQTSDMQATLYEYAAQIKNQIEAQAECAAKLVERLDLAQMKVKLHRNATAYRQRRNCNLCSRVMTLERIIMKLMFEQTKHQQAPWTDGEYDILATPVCTSASSDSGEGKQSSDASPACNHEQGGHTGERLGEASHPGHGRSQGHSRSSYRRCSRSRSHSTPRFRGHEISSSESIHTPNRNNGESKEQALNATVSAAEIDAAVAGRGAASVKKRARVEADVEKTNNKRKK